MNFIRENKTLTAVLVIAVIILVASVNHLRADQYALETQKNYENEANLDAEEFLRKQERAERKKKKKGIKHNEKVVSKLLEWDSMPEGKKKDKFRKKMDAKAAKNLKKYNCKHFGDC